MVINLRLILSFISLLTVSLFYQNCGGYFNASSFRDKENSPSTNGPINPETGFPTSIDGSINFPKVRGKAQSLTSKLRLLSGHELMNTIESLTTYKVPVQLDFSDKSSGFITGDNLTLDSNTLNNLIPVTEAAISEYFKLKARQDFICLKQSFKQDCYNQVMRGFAEISYRRPLTNDESGKLITLYTKINAELNDNLKSLHMVLSKILLSPSFLYRSEIGNLNSASGQQLDPYEKATFISYALTGSTPDKELYQLAKSGQLTASNISTQVNRILNTDKSKKWFNGFFRDWLRLDKLNEMREKPEAFSKFKNKEIPGLLNQEFDLFIKNIVFDQNGSTLDLLTSNKTFANSKTGFIYKQEITSSKMVEVQQGKGRAGILTLASVMASHASDVDAETDKPVGRGVLIQNQILCEEVGFPIGLSLAAAEDKINKQHPKFADYTIRKQHEVAMNQDATCTSCHSQFMPFGYLSSHFNALGEIKILQKGEKIDSKATPTIGGQSHDYNNVSEMIIDLAGSQNYKYCFSQKMGSFIFGSAEEMINGQLSWLMLDHHESSGGKIKNMLEKVLSDSRVYQRRSK